MLFVDETLLVLSSNWMMASPVAFFEGEGELLGSVITGFTIWIALEGTGMAEDGFIMTQSKGLFRHPENGRSCSRRPFDQ
jgi:hypothetical protein